MKKLWLAFFLAAFLFVAQPVRAETPATILVGQAFLAGVKLGCYRAMILETEKYDTPVLEMEDCQAIIDELTQWVEAP